MNKVLLLKLFYPLTVQEVLHTGSLLGHVHFGEWYLHMRIRSDQICMTRKDQTYVYTDV